MKQLKNYLPYVIIFIILALFIQLTGDLPETRYSNLIYEKAHIINIEKEDLKPDQLIPSLSIGTQIVTLKVISGDFTGEIYTVTNHLSKIYNTQVERGDTIIVSIDPTGKAKDPVSITSYHRENTIKLLLGLFFLVLLIFGGLQGFKTIITLIITGICLLYGFFPLIFQQMSPILAAILTVSVITISSFVLISGFNLKTLSAILGTLFGVIIAGVLTHYSSQAIHLIGLVTEDGERLIEIAYTHKIKIQGLMFAGILIASLGAIMDVSMSIASSIQEVKKHHPKPTFKELFLSGMSVGRDVMGTMSNTLILAFTGASLNMIIFIIAYGLPYNQWINMDIVTMELIQGLAGSIGIVLTVPLTATITSFLLMKELSLK